MKENILAAINDPGQLERYYRSNKSEFRRDFNSVYTEIQGSSLAQFWYERLNFEKEEVSWGSRKEILFVLSSALLAGLIAKIPHLLGVSEDFFYPRNIGFIFLPLLTAYFAWKSELNLKRIVTIGAVFIACLLYINLYPASSPENDIFILICIHLPLLLWILLGSAFVGNDLSNNSRRLSFLSYNGDLLIITGLILIAGGIMTGVTIGLFSAIGLNIEDFYFRNVVIFGLPAAPIIGNYLIQKNPQLVGKVSPVIARIFCPLVLVMLVIYLAAMLFAGGDPYNDRDFLLVFNVLLIGVMAIIFFSVAGASENTHLEKWMLFLLSVVTIIVNGIALSAIMFRIAAWGITPNRLAVMGANILILTHLLLVATNLYKTASGKGTSAQLERSIAGYIPVYVIWLLIVVFLFPLLFSFT
ncbi:hypothetical protein [Salinimicrobium sp. TH3]|uniref:hypothetical protein n=1 Tax=Salinimicrobium sp. TH3 TaxID=2997342 RepID=UPI0022763569|nr:hypothetical protein [Salinimicrobium sp. TH3]MCY2687339.1 hypothetical protein [Salinimicrobium sp. TH3]